MAAVCQDAHTRPLPHAEDGPDYHGPLPVLVVVEGVKHLPSLLLQLRQGGRHWPVQLLLLQEFRKKASNATQECRNA